MSIGGALLLTVAGLLVAFVLVSAVRPCPPPSLPVFVRSDGTLFFEPIRMRIEATGEASAERRARTLYEVDGESLVAAHAMSPLGELLGLASDTGRPTFWSWEWSDEKPTIRHLRLRDERGELLREIALVVPPASDPERVYGSPTLSPMGRFALVEWNFSLEGTWSTSWERIDLASGEKVPLCELGQPSSSEGRRALAVLDDGSTIVAQAIGSKPFFSRVDDRGVEELYLPEAPLVTRPLVLANGSVLVITPNEAASEPIDTEIDLADGSERSKSVSVHRVGLSGYEKIVDRLPIDPGSFPEATIFVRQSFFADPTGRFLVHVSSEGRVTRFDLESGETNSFAALEPLGDETWEESQERVVEARRFASEADPRELLDRLATLDPREERRAALRISTLPPSETIPRILDEVVRTSRTGSASIAEDVLWEVILAANREEASALFSAWRAENGALLDEKLSRVSRFIEND